MHTVQGTMITYHGCSNGNNNPMYNVHKTVGAHCTWQNTVFVLISLGPASRSGMTDSLGWVYVYKKLPNHF